MKWKNGFALVELLIAVAILALLSAIAAPNYLASQNRSKIARARNDLRTLRVGLEAYRMENPFYPNDSPDEAYSWAALTTPIAFIDSIPRAAYQAKSQNPQKWYLYWGGTHLAGSSPLSRDIQTRLYAITCVGPDLVYDCSVYYDLWSWTDPARQGTYYESANFINSVYDPTNGAISRGDIVATQKGLF
jgi:prepilin-type N-terminal cleavage/methylation domain-containing protein